MTSSYKDKTIVIVTIILIILTFVAFNLDFRTSILSGFIFATLSYPVFKILKNTLIIKSEPWLNQKFNSKVVSNDMITNLAAISTVLVIGTITAFLTQFLIREVSLEIVSLSNNPDFFSWLPNLGINPELVQSIVNFSKLRVNNALQTFVSFDNINKLVTFSASIFNTILGQVIYIIIFLISWYNALIYGSDWIHTLFKFINLKTGEEKQIKESLKGAVRNIIYANLLSGVLNGLGILLIMSIFGLPGAFLMTILAFVIGFLPLTPSELAYLLPIFIIALSNPLLAVGVAIAAELFILWQNYAFLPGIVLNGNTGNPLFIITSVISGINYFGVMGFIIGPVLMILITNLTQILLQRTQN